MDNGPEDALMLKQRHSWLMAAVAVAAFSGAGSAAAQGTGTPSPEWTPSPQLGLQAPLDLRAPAVTDLFSPAALQLMLVEQQETNSEPDDVRVQSPRATPDVPHGMFRALPWAIMHPTQSWRILAPISQ